MALAYHCVHTLCNTLRSHKYEPIINKKSKIFMYILFIGRIGIRSIYYYASTTISAVILGIILVLIIRPGEFSSHNLTTNAKVKPPRNVTTVDTLLDLVRYNNNKWSPSEINCHYLLRNYFIPVFFLGMYFLRISYKLALLKYV